MRPKSAGPSQRYILGQKMRGVLDGKQHYSKATANWVMRKTSLGSVNSEEPMA